MSAFSRIAVAVTTAGALLLCAGCSAETSSPGSKDSKVQVVASTPVWADIAKAVAETAQDSNVEVNSVITDGGVDPHHFEPTAADIAKARDADVLVVNGGGYDAWLYEAVDSPEPIHALPLVEHGGLDKDTSVPKATINSFASDGTLKVIDGNEHIWYDPVALKQVAGQIAEQINAKDPDAHASADPVSERIDKLQDRLGTMKDRRFAQTEPIADYLLAGSGAKESTPAGFRKATLNEGETSAADLARFLELIKSNGIDLLVFNPQTTTDTTDRIRQAAKDANVPVVEIGETPPDQSNFLDYYSRVVGELESAAR